MAEDFSIAVGLRPPDECFPLLWHSLTELIASIAGIGETFFVLKILGPVFLFLSGALVAWIVYLLLPAGMVSFLRRFRRGRIFLWSILFLAGALFSLSEIVWQTSLAFTPELFRLSIFLAAIVLMCKAARSFAPGWIVAAAFFFALVAAESSLGFLSLAAFPFLCRKSLKAEEPGAEDTAEGFLDRNFAPRRFVTFFVFFYFAAVVLNIRFFNAHSPEGLLSGGAFFGLFNYFSGYLSSAVSVFSVKKILIVLGMLFAPFVLSLYLSAKICRLDAASSVFQVFAAFAVFVLMAAQSFDFPTAWFWSWLDGAMADASGFILALSILLTSLSASLTFASLGVEILFKNYRAIGVSAMKEAAMGDLEVRPPVRLKMPRRVMQVIYCLVLPLVLLMLAAPKIGGVRSEARAILSDAVKLIVDECARCEYLFSDGSIDAEIEVESLRRGGSLKALSFMSGTSRSDVYLRTRGETDLERIATLETGAAEALRHWVRSNDPLLSKVALQVGFELWVHDKRPLPQICGLSACIQPWDVSQREDFVLRAHSLAERILALASSRENLSRLDPRLYSQICSVQFRLARIASMRAMQHFADGESERGAEERALADRLDDANRELRRIRELMDIYTRQKGLNLTPREGLKIGLIIKDLNFARFYAAKVVRFAPEDIEANYILGVALIAENDLAGAEHHLRICEKRSPENPSVLSNLAVVLLRLGRIDEAEDLAVRAEKLAPNVSEIANTLRDVRKAKNSIMCNMKKEKAK